MNNYYVWVEITANMNTILDEMLFAQAMENCCKAGIDSVILSVKDTSGFVLYPSKYADHYSKYNTKFQDIDYLQRCIGIIHKWGMKVYASFDVFTEGRRRNSSPYMKGLTNEGWMCEVYGLNEENEPVVQKITDETPIKAVGAMDDFHDIFVNPANDEVVEYELHLIDEVMNEYDIDGIVLDRVRYIGLSADFSELTMTKWKQACGITGDVSPEDIYKLTYENDKLEIAYGKYFSSFNTFRAQTIKKFIEKVRQKVEQANKKIDFVDYTGSWYPEYYSVAANWASVKHLEASYPATEPAEYAKTGYIEYVDKMLSGFYYVDVTIEEARKHNMPQDWYSVEGAADIAYQVTHHEKPIVGSLYLFQYSQNPDDIRRAVDMCFRKSDGCMLFDLCYLVNNNWWEYVCRTE